MKLNEYFKSLSQEVYAVKDRVRHIINDRHWLTDGEWKESVIRQILRRHLPSSANVGRGFVVTAKWSSHQIDVLVYDATKPVIFRDGDLVFVTPDAVLGIIEVKSKATPAIISKAAKKLADDMQPIRQHPNSSAFAAIYAFEDAGNNSQSYLNGIAKAAHRWNNRIDFVCCGDSRFIKYWHFDPKNHQRMYEGWHSYHLPGTSPGYFLHNVIDSISPESVFMNKDVWFPKRSKEVYQDGEILGKWKNHEEKS